MLTPWCIERGGIPAAHNGSEFTSKSLAHWAYGHRIKLDSSRPAKPTDKAPIKAFNSLVRRECLSQHWFFDLEDARRVLD